MTNRIRVCVDQHIASEEAEQVRQLSIAANPDNYVPPSPFEAAAQTRWLWANGTTIKVKFLDGDRVVQRRVEEYAHVWSKYANIKFDFGPHAFAPIRISFKIKGQSWSYVGTQAYWLFDQNQPTMNFGWLEPDSSEEEFASVVLHEFGHALGLIHEHQHPENGIPWNREAVFDYYSGPPNNWKQSYIERNVLSAYSHTQTQYSDFDLKSIMLYPIPNEHTVGDWSVDWDNDQLSETDKQFIGTLYPFPEGQEQDGADGTEHGSGAGEETDGAEGTELDSTLTTVNRLAAAAPGDGVNDPAQRVQRNQLAYAIRSEVQNLQNVIETIQSGESSLKDNAVYIKKTVEDIPVYVAELVKLERNDLGRNIENLWERMHFNPLLQNPEQDFEAQEQANHLNILNTNISQIVALVGEMTIPDRINDWLEQSRPGYYFSFHEVFEDELPQEQDRERLLKFLGWAPNVLKNGLVDTGSGLIYRYDDDREAQKQSLLHLLYTLLGTVAFIILLALPSLVDETWQLKMTHIPTLLVGWLAVLIGVVVHVLIGSYKRSREQGGLPPMIAVGDLSLWLNAKSGQLILRLGLALFAFVALASGAGPANVTMLNAFLLGYSLDSFVEIFSGSLDSRATNLTSDLKKQLSR